MPKFIIYSKIVKQYTLFSEYPLGETLEQFLQRRGMMLTWGETYDLMMPVIRTMQLIHEDGIIHRGISPSTIYITSSGKAKLSGFGISAVRAARTELTAELFPGFSLLNSIPRLHRMVPGRISMQSVQYFTFA